MTKEEWFRAIGEVREDQIEAAETVKKLVHPWRRLGAVAACLALVVTAAIPWINGQLKWKAIVRGFTPSPAVTEGMDSGGGTGAGGVDGTRYWTDRPAGPARPSYSTGVEIGELAEPGPGLGDGLGIGAASCMAYLTAEELFAQDTVIFRGTVQELQYFCVEPETGGMRDYYTRAIVKVTDSIRGDQAVGETYGLLWLGVKGYVTTSLTDPLENLDAGSDAIFMPVRTDQGTGWKTGSSYFCYADLAEYYLSEGMRYVFADTGEGLDFARGAYLGLETAETLDDVAAYIREMTGEREEARNDGVIGEEPLNSGGYVFIEGTENPSECIVPQPYPAVSQAEPSETVEADAPEVPWVRWKFLAELS